MCFRPLSEYRALRLLARQLFLYRLLAGLAAGLGDGRADRRHRHQRQHSLEWCVGNFAGGY